MLFLILSSVILVPIVILSVLASIEMLFNQYNPIHNYYWPIGIVTGIIVIAVIFYNYREHNFIFENTNVTVEYRDGKVDLANERFDSLIPPSKGETFNGAWYDEEQDYMIIRLGNKYYHYCGMPTDAWRNFNTSEVEGYGTKLYYMYYEQSIKGNFDCRVNKAPNY